ncbi:MAG: M14-type cytosolic carboxypeptidase [Erythrobacter sp.]
MSIALTAAFACSFSPALAADDAVATSSFQASADVCSTRLARIDKSFPTGAYAQCKTTTKKHFKLTISPEDDGDINCSAWYAFRVQAERKTRIKVDLNYTKCGHRYWPKTSTDGVNWTFMLPKHVAIEGERGERTARLTLKVGKEPVFVAAQEIFPPSIYDAWLAERQKASFATVSMLGKSAHDRPIKLLRIAQPDTEQRETIVLVGRQHPPEVTGALAMLPFVETIMGDSDLAIAYRARFETLVVPLLNPDGVVYGHWRHNTGGVDLNRDWGPFTQPETTLMQGLLEGIETDPERDMRALIDFHSTGRDVFYTIPDELPTDPELFTKKWLEIYQTRMPGYDVNRDARHAEGRPISKAHAFDVYGAPGITFEIGDETDRQLIKRIGRESAIAMMQALLDTPLPSSPLSSGDQ